LQIFALPLIRETSPMHKATEIPTEVFQYVGMDLMSQAVQHMMRVHYDGSRPPTAVELALMREYAIVLAAISLLCDESEQCQLNKTITKLTYNYTHKKDTL
jgi:hypothetical protein